MASGYPWTDSTKHGRKDVELRPEGNPCKELRFATCLLLLSSGSFVTLRVKGAELTFVSTGFLGCSFGPGESRAKCPPALYSKGWLDAG
jgi:hypothetical protein